MAYFVYILGSEKDGTYYVGHANNVNERLNRHNQGRTVYTRGKCPWKLVYQEADDSRAEAMRREREIKERRSRDCVDHLVRASRD
jgi:putative endonuclease